MPIPGSFLRSAGKSANATGGWTVRPTVSCGGSGRLSTSNGSSIATALHSADGRHRHRHGHAACGFIQLKYLDDRFQTGGQVLPRRRRLHHALQPWPQYFHAGAGRRHGRRRWTSWRTPAAHGATINANATLVPKRSPRFSMVGNRRWAERVTRGSIATSADGNGGARSSDVDFSALVHSRDLAMRRTGDKLPRRTNRGARQTLTGSALFAYKINWQSGAVCRIRATTARPTPRTTAACWPAGVREKCHRLSALTRHALRARHQGISFGSAVVAASKAWHAAIWPR